MSNASNSLETYDGIVRTGRIMTGAFLVGLIAFSLVVVFLGTKGEEENVPLDDSTPFISYFAVLVASTAVVASMIVPRVILSSWRTATAPSEIPPENSDEAEKFFGPKFLTARVLVPCAMFEGATFLTLVALLLEGQAWLWGIVAALLILIASRFPDLSKLRHFESNQRQLMALEP